MTGKLIAQSGIHCIGNGRAAGYYLGADVQQMFGPCYSMPSVLGLILEENIACSSFRCVRTGVWKASLEGIGEIWDFAHPSQPMLFRRLSLNRPLTFRLESEFLFSAEAFGENCLLFCVPAGTTIFSGCKTDDEIFCRLDFSDGVVWQDGRLTFPAGESTLTFFGGDKGDGGGDSFYACMKLPVCSPEEALAGEFARWEEFFGRLRDFSPLLEGHPRREELEDAIDSMAVALKTQTAVQGGIMAGKYYHLGYGRDMYGAFRGYLALGLTDEARECIEFFRNVWEKDGLGFPNAAGMGMRCAHRHENDDVEATGYHLLALCDYFAASGDEEFLRESAGYISALLAVQERNLAGGMLPFNGDETYIAGGMLPRDCIDHGSMEATALYIAGAERILALCDRLGVAVSADREALAGCRAGYRANFLRQGRVITNNPARVEIARLADHRHGVCWGCGRMDYLRRNHRNGWLCAECFGRKDRAASNIVHVLDCALLMTGFVGADLPGEELLLPTAREAALTAGDKPSVGYEQGLLLYVLPDSPESEGLLDRVLRRRTGTGVWCEYYHADGRPNEGSCPYRPWESGINLCGIIRHLERTK